MHNEEQVLSQKWQLNDALAARSVFHIPPASRKNGPDDCRFIWSKKNQKKNALNSKAPRRSHLSASTPPY